MSYLYGTACLDLAREITDVMESTLTTGGTTTCADASMPITTPADDWYNNGTLFLKVCTHTGNNGITRRITDFANTGGVFTLESAVPDTHTQAGDTYAVMDKKWTYGSLRQSVNKALMEIGDVDQQDVTTTTTADQEYYTLPTGFYNVKRIELATSKTAPYNYVELNHWNELEGQIQFISGHQPGVTGYILRLTCNMPLAEITSDATAIPNNINPEWLKWVAAVHAYRWRLHRVGGDDPVLKQLLNEALAKKDMAEKKYKPQLKRIPPHFEQSIWAVNVARWDTTEPDPGTARLK